MDNSNKNNKLIERCKCGNPIVKRLNSREFEFIKYHKGKTQKVPVKHSGDRFDIFCEKCGHDNAFMVKEITLGMTYVIAPPKKV